MPEYLSATAITESLGTRFIGQRVIYYPSLASTMDAAEMEARRGAAEGTVVVAGEQTAGRGRMKRAWLSLKGSLALSVILYPDAAYLAYLVMLASLSVLHSIEAVTGLEARVKWPNDVLINGRKVCGILIENELQGRKVHYANIGIGINVNLRLAELPEIRSIATSLSDELGKEVSPLEIVRQLLREMEEMYTTLPEGRKIFAEWRESLVTLGRRVTARWGDTRCEGIAESVAQDGSLLLRQPDGTLTRIVAGDVTLRD